MHYLFPNNISGGGVAVSVVLIVALVALLIVWTVQRSGERRRRLDLLAAALRNPSLSPETQRDLVRSLQPTRGKWMFVLGWFGLFGGIAWLCCEPSGDDWKAGVMLTVLSFAMMTWPFALRELETRRA